MSSSFDATVMVADAPPRREAPARRVTRCFHCGAPCPDAGLAKQDRHFCCHGCLTVHEILTQAGMDHFYDLNERPGARIGRSVARGQFDYLDEPALQQTLLDFTDGRQSRITLHIPAIHCLACVWLLENLFRLHPGVGHSRVNFPRREVAITFSTEKLRLSELVELLVSIGYEPALSLGEMDKRAARPARTALRRQWLQVGMAGFAFGNVMLFSLPQYFGLDGFSGPAFQKLFGWLSLALALPVVLFSASDYWKSALLSLRQRELTLEVPIALGLVALYGRSVYEILSGTGEGYCDSLTGLIFFLLCGRVFQQKTHERLAFDRDYKAFFPLSVARKHRGRAGVDADPCPGEERICLAQLRVGDRIVIRNRELIPADAKLVGGPAFIDYSFVTGESEPVTRSKGDYLYAGGQQIGAAIELETVKPVSHSYLASLWNHSAFQKQRNDIHSTLTDQYSRWFILAVVGVALGAAAWWIAAGDPPRAIKSFASVLIVACPCALALAAPFTLGTAQRWLSRLGVFLKNAVTLERMARVNTVVFDKTGTLTATGANVVGFHGEPLAEVEESWVHSLTRQSTHPHSIRIGESLADRYFPEPVRSFLETPGCGIEGQVDGHEIWLGARAWLESRLGPYSKQKDRDNRGASPGNASVVHLAIDGRHRGAFVLSSALRPETDRLIRRLARRYELALLSGDNERERDRFRALFGDDARLRFNQSPLDKLGFIRRLQESGRTVMMVGDGLNDAGALKQSDVGVAVVESVGAFSPASDVILAASCVPRLGEVLDLSCRAARIVWWSIGISALYNVLGVSIAATGVLSPVVCAVLMPLSSVCVVLFACGATTWAAQRTITKPASQGSETGRRPESGTGARLRAVRKSDLGFPSDFEVQTQIEPHS